MKASSKKIRHTLNVDNDRTDHYIGLVSTEPDYKVSILINKKLGINLKSDSGVIKPVKGNEVVFARFAYSSEYSDIVFDLINNYTGKEKLFVRLPSVDFILRIRGTNNYEYIDELSQKLRKIKNLTGVFVLDCDKQLDYPTLQIIP
ncbi:MAG TPA: IPExxxVDY family protein [Bacteroidales bacterium]|nr:IPExxxVDY family protein [Bacteroidales bacterium]